MLCQAKAFFPASMNSGGTARWARRACCSAARTSSSSQPLVTLLTPWLLNLDIVPRLIAEDGGQMR